MEWLCKICWRRGKFMVDLPFKEAMRVATHNHRYMVDLDMRAAKVPAGMQAWANSPVMDKYCAVDCEGDIRIGISPVKKKKLKDETPEFHFGGDTA